MLNVALVRPGCTDYDQQGRIQGTLDIPLCEQGRQEHPETICPPSGELVEDAQERVRAALNKLLRKHAEGKICLVVPEPLASMVKAALTHAELGDLWEGLGGGASCERLQIQPQTAG